MPLAGPGRPGADAATRTTVEAARASASVASSPRATAATAPGSTPRQLYRLVDAVLESEAGRTYRWRDTSLIPRRVLPPQSLVVALSPLVDWYVTRALLNLRRRGFDLAIIEVDPVGFAVAERERQGELAWRTWLLERDVTRSRLAGAGVSITRWRPDEPIAAAIEHLEKSR